jgi:hypothetical protein
MNVKYVTYERLAVTLERERRERYFRVALFLSGVFIAMVWILWS